MSSQQFSAIQFELAAAGASIYGGRLVEKREYLSAEEIQGMVRDGNSIDWSKATRSEKILFSMLGSGASIGQARRSLTILSQLRAMAESYPDVLGELDIQDLECQRMYALPEVVAGIGIYNRFRVQGRSVNSCYQISLASCLEAARDERFLRLPSWVQGVLLRQDKYQPSRMAKRERLIQAARAWKHCPGMPSKLAFQVGGWEPSLRAKAVIIWRTLESWYPTEDVDGGVLRRLRLLEFGARMRQPLSMDVLEGAYTPHVEAALNLPHGLLAKGTGLRDQLIQCEALDQRQKCRLMFGTEGKATVKLSQTASADAWLWASALWFGKPDQIQKVLAIPQGQLLPFHKGVIEILREVGDGPALRLIQQRTIQVQGDVTEIERWYLDDTVELWNRTADEPRRLGRIRSWTDIHDGLAMVIVKKQKNDPLPVDHRWSVLDRVASTTRDWEIVLPTCAHDLVHWGEVQKHCVGGYTRKVQSGDSVILGLYVEGRPTYTIEICPRGEYIRQFYGMRNSSPPLKLEEDVKWAINHVK